MSVNYLTKFLAHSKCIWILAFIMIIVFIISGLPLLLLMPASITTKAAACQRPEHMFSVGCCPLSLPKLLTPAWLEPMVSITKVFCFVLFLILSFWSCLMQPLSRDLDPRRAWLRNSALGILLSELCCSGERDGGGKAPDLGFIFPTKGQQWEDT